MKHISLEQRYQIEAYQKVGKSKDFIANELNLHRSTIYREIKRNAQKQGNYSGKTAQLYANERKERFFVKRKFTNECIKLVRQYIEEKWSPEQIVGYCKKHAIPMVSHERIYQFIREDKKNGGNLYKHLRHQLKHRKRSVGKHFPIKDRVSIEQRPTIVAQKERFGDWEMDTIIGKNQQGAILTFTERSTNFLMMVKLKYGKSAVELAKQFIALSLPYKNSIHTITTDNGAEFAEHKAITTKLDAPIYFTHPYCSWEKGTIENANKLVRQYLPKNTNFNDITDAQLLSIQHKINKRPRKKLNFECPKDIFYNFVNGIVAFGT